jgi:hypothetical protein
MYHGKMRGKGKGTSSKYIGVSFCKLTNNWRTQLYINKKSRSFGHYKTEEEAMQAIRSAVITNNLQEFYPLENYL